jgi:hypothetical protein
MIPYGQWPAIVEPCERKPISSRAEPSCRLRAHGALLQAAEPVGLVRRGRRFERGEQWAQLHDMAACHTQGHRHLISTSREQACAVLLVLAGEPLAEEAKRQHHDQDYWWRASEPKALKRADDRVQQKDQQKCQRHWDQHHACPEQTRNDQDQTRKGIKMMFSTMPCCAFVCMMMLAPHPRIPR